MDEPEFSDSAGYFANIMFGQPGPDKYVDALLVVCFRGMVGLLLDDYVERRGEEGREAIIAILRQWKSVLKSSHAQLVEKHCAMIEGSTLGKVFGSVVGDGESIRLQMHEKLKSAEEIVVALFEPFIGKIEL